MFGHVAICTQNLAISGANQVLLNLVEGEFVKLGEIVVISPTDGPFAAYFMRAGCSVRIGGAEILQGLRTVRLAVCNTVMTAHLVLAFAQRGVPQIWILHEWWPREMLEEELAKRALSYLSQQTVDEAMKVCSRVVCVCEAQKAIYSLQCPSTAIYVGVPPPTQSARERCLARTGDKTRPVRFLTLGIVCPRKNQMDAARLFRQFAGDRTDVTLDIVGARYVRDYERDYCAQVVEAIGTDERIKLHPVTDDPSGWYSRSDVLLFLSVNEVTPLVIAEAALHGVPSIVYDVGGIKEMVTPETGYLLQQGDEAGVIDALRKLSDNAEARVAMGVAAEKHAERFTVPFMTRRYESLANELAPTVVLLDMDGVIVDWDVGFIQEWEKFGHKASDIDRSKSYFMEDCVPTHLRGAALAVMNQPGFFRNLPAVPGAVDAVRAMVAEGFSLYVCTSPLPTNPTCCQDKLDWVKEHLGDVLPLERIVMTRDKTMIIGDVLIDDKPEVTGTMTPTWEHIIFDAPYNRNIEKGRQRMRSWDWWTSILAQRLGPMNPIRQRLMSSGGSPMLTPASLPRNFSFPNAMNFQLSGLDLGITKYEVRALRDFSDELPNLRAARESYLRWRKGGSKGMQGSNETQHDVGKMVAQLEAASSARNFLDTDEGVDDIYVLRKQFRAQYAAARSGKVKRIPSTHKMKFLIDPDPMV